MISVTAGLNYEDYRALAHTDLSFWGAEGIDISTAVAPLEVELVARSNIDADILERLNITEVGTG